MSLTSKERKELKARAHHLKPVIRVGHNGISDAVVKETDIALTAHELIKVHIQSDDRGERQTDAEALAGKTGSELVASIGKTFILFRSNEAT